MSSHLNLCFMWLRFTITNYSSLPAVYDLLWVCLLLELKKRGGCVFVLRAPWWMCCWARICSTCTIPLRHISLVHVSHHPCRHLQLCRSPWRSKMYKCVRVASVYICATNPLCNRPTCMRCTGCSYFPLPCYCKVENTSVWGSVIPGPDWILGFNPRPLVWPGGVGLVPRDEGFRNIEQEGCFLEQTDRREQRDCGDLHSPPYAVRVTHSNTLD